MTASSVRDAGSTIESLPSPRVGWPEFTTYSRLSSPTARKRAFAPDSGIESTEEPPQHGSELSQLGPIGAPFTTFPFATKSRPRTRATACGYTPTGKLAVSPERKLRRVTVLSFGFATQAIESSSITTPVAPDPRASGKTTDRKSTRLNSSHGYISYAVFCLKKKKTTRHLTDMNN